MFLKFTTFYSLYAFLPSLLAVNEAVFTIILNLCCQQLDVEQVGQKYVEWRTIQIHFMYLNHM